MKYPRITFVLRNNCSEFSFYLILGIVVPAVLILLQTYGVLSNVETGISVLFSVFVGFALVRLFEEMRTLESWLEKLTVVHQQVSVWTCDMETLKRKWGSQLVWLKEQVTGQSPPNRYLLPHEFSRISVELVEQIPSNLEKNKLIKLKGSIRSVNHKIDHLNFLVQKLHFREAISKKEYQEIKGLVVSHPTSIINTLGDELLAIDCELRMILKEYEYD